MRTCKIWWSNRHFGAAVLARILEDRLMSILSVGEASPLLSRKKRSMAKKELGSRIFLQSDV